MLINVQRIRKLRQELDNAKINAMMVSNGISLITVVLNNALYISIHKQMIEPNAE